MATQDESDKLRVMNIELALFGMWDMDSMALNYFFLPNNVLEVLVGGGFPISRNVTYEVFLKDNNPFIKIINPHSKNDKIEEMIYNLLEIDTANGILRLKNPKGLELSFTKHKPFGK